MEQREDEDEVQDRPEQAPEVREGCHEDDLEERDACHLADGLCLVDLPEIRYRGFPYPCFYIGSDPARVEHGIERCHPCNPETGQGRIRVAAGKQGKSCGKYAVDQDPEEKGVEEHGPADAGECNGRKQECKEPGDRKPEELPPWERLWFAVKRIERRQGGRILHVAGDAVAVTGADDCKDAAFGALDFQQDELVGNKRVPFVDQCPGTVRGELAELFHDRIDHVLFLEGLDVEFFSLADFRDGEDEGKDHLDLLDDAHRFPEPQERKPDIAIHERNGNVAALGFGNRRFHLGAGFNADIDADLALEVGKEPLDKKRVEVLYFQNIVYGRVACLFF